jgi:hypothetical protein
VPWPLRRILAALNHLRVQIMHHYLRELGAGPAKEPRRQRVHRQDIAVVPLGVGRGDRGGGTPDGDAARGEGGLKPEVDRFQVLQVQLAPVVRQQRRVVCTRRTTPSPSAAAAKHNKGKGAQESKKLAQATPTGVHIV